MEYKEYNNELELDENKNIVNTNPNEIFINMINIQKNKEIKQDIWKDSPYKDLVKLQSNNVGNVGETFIQNICDIVGIDCNINGIKRKKIGGGEGDGIIKNKSIEIKTSHLGSKIPSFQHELGEFPWNSEFMLFIDVSPYCIYITIFKNFNEEFYKSKNKCIPYFPTKSITWRKGSGAFKLDTTISINEKNIQTGYTYKLNQYVNLYELKEFIELNIK